ncbi:hypothetical protein AB1Y20_005373 [Prymnesium parvum]|uniref:Nickel/cobalt efflux system n=1 Tax=Prymnesium parvum TaxID=97485 RepID=A0AB34J437_PRYPA
MPSLLRLPLPLLAIALRGSCALHAAAPSRGLVVPPHPPLVHPSLRAGRAPPPRALLAAVDARLLAAATGGSFAGGLHAVTGPDHLSALLPLCIGRRWWVSMYAGAYWGLGHGIGAALVGALAFAARGALNIDAYSTYMEAAVGLSIMVIGANGVREAREWTAEIEANEAAEAAEGAVDRGPVNPVTSIAMMEVQSQSISERTSVVSTLTTGIIAGCTGSGHLLGVLPALAMPNWICAASYLGCFGIGTAFAMMVFTALVGELSSQMSARLEDPTLPAKLGMASSVFALVIGALWTVRAVVLFELPWALWGRLYRQWFRSILPSLA